MTATKVFVVFGAIVRADGTPSGALVRRVEGAARLACDSAAYLLIVSGGVHLAAVSEAAVMKSLLLAKGIPAEKIIEDPNSADTLDSVVHCARLIRALGSDPEVIVCSDRYHMPRCWWLFRLLGIEARMGEMPSARAAIGMKNLLYWSAREIPATIIDTFLLIGMRIRGQVVRSA